MLEQGPGSLSKASQAGSGVSGQAPWSFPPFTTSPLTGTSGFSSAPQNFLRQSAAPPLQQQVCCNNTSVK